MYDPLVKQYEEAFGIEGKRKRGIKCFFRRLKRYRTYVKAFGVKRAKKLL